MATVEQKQRVKTYWEREACGEIHSEAPEGAPEFYAEVEQRREELEPHIERFADFAGARGLSVLEIGVGLGTDFIRFVRAGAKATGVDLTERAIGLVRRRLELEGLDADLRVADAEALPFEDGSFDRVYSWGVLHHTPETQQAVREAIRVLRPGGTLCVMMYARHSWVGYGFWVRHALLAGRPWRSVATVLARHMESEGTKAYTRSELARMFAGVEELRIDKVATVYDRQLAGPLARLTGDRLGWQYVIRGRKPS
ncbi:MAG TPA: class I SAM-dependent methyltransferase [Gaiellaceae bacterium]|nr:class I SAM-dependent methyltransferase [Gaiellaceae bacterium]